MPAARSAKRDDERVHRRVVSSVGMRTAYLPTSTRMQAPIQARTHPSLAHGPAHEYTRARVHAHGMSLEADRAHAPIDAHAMLPARIVHEAGAHASMNAWMHGCVLA